MTFVEDSIGETNPRGGFEIHNVVLLSQGEFNGLEVSVAHEKVVVFADEAVGTTTGLYIEVQLARGSATGSAGVRVTFSGYVEDLPTAPLVRR